MKEKQRYRTGSKFEFPPVNSVSQPKHILPDKDMPQSEKLKKAARWSEVQGGWLWCGISLLYPKAADNGSGGRTCASFASVVCCSAQCEWRGVLHMGDWAGTFAVVPLHVYSPADLYLSKYLSLLWMVHSIVEDRHAAVILQWEGSGDHLPHEMTLANKKQHSLVTHTLGYFTELTGVDASCGYLDDLCHKNISQTTRCTVRCFGNILHPYNTLICHWRPDHSIFGTVYPCTTAGCPDIP